MEPTQRKILRQLGYKIFLTPSIDKPNPVTNTFSWCNLLRHNLLCFYFLAAYIDITYFRYTLFYYNMQIYERYCILLPLLTQKYHFNLEIHVLMYT